MSWQDDPIVSTMPPPVSQDGPIVPQNAPGVSADWQNDPIIQPPATPALDAWKNDPIIEQPQQQENFPIESPPPAEVLNPAATSPDPLQRGLYESHLQQAQMQQQSQTATMQRQQQMDAAITQHNQQQTAGANAQMDPYRRNVRFLELMNEMPTVPEGLPEQQAASIAAQRQWLAAHPELRQLMDNETDPNMREMHRELLTQKMSPGFTAYHGVEKFQRALGRINAQRTQKAGGFIEQGAETGQAFGAGMESGALPGVLGLGPMTQGTIGQYDRAMEERSQQPDFAQKLGHDIRRQGEREYQKYAPTPNEMGTVQRIAEGLTADMPMMLASGALFGQAGAAAYVAGGRFAEIPARTEQLMAENPQLSKAEASARAVSEKIYEAVVDAGVTYLNAGGLNKAGKGIKAAAKEALAETPAAAAIGLAQSAADVKIEGRDILSEEGLKEVMQGAATQALMHLGFKAPEVMGQPRAKARENIPNLIDGERPTGQGLNDQYVAPNPRNHIGQNGEKNASTVQGPAQMGEQPRGAQGAGSGGREGVERGQQGPALAREGEQIPSIEQRPPAQAGEQSPPPLFGQQPRPLEPREPAAANENQIRPEQRSANDEGQGANQGIAPEAMPAAHGPTLTEPTAPRTVYRGSFEGESRLLPRTPKLSDGGYDIHGIYFAPDADTARMYADMNHEIAGKGKVQSYEVALKNPATQQTERDFARRAGVELTQGEDAGFPDYDQHSAIEITRALQRAGYDGVIRDSGEVIVFDPASAKRPESAGAKTRFSRADLESQLLDYHQRTAGTQGEAEQSALDQAASGDAFAFRDSLPEEVKNYLEGRPNLRRKLRVYKPGEAGYENAGGMDALSQMGEDAYFAHLDRAGNDNLPSALEAARKSPEPDVAFLAHVYDNLPPPREGVAMEWTDAQKLRPGQSFEISGHKFRVMEDEQGYRVLKDGDEYPITPVDALERIPIDKGSIDQQAPEPAVVDAFARKAEEARARLKERFARQSQRLGKRTAGGSIFDPLFEPEVLKDLAIVGAHAIYKGVRNLKDFTEHMVREVGEWVRPQIRKLYMAARKEYNASTQEDKQARKIIREQSVPKSREAISTRIRRETGLYKRDPKIIISEVKNLRTWLRKLKTTGDKAYELGAREKGKDLQGLKREFVDIIRKSLPTEDQGKLIGDVANITTRGQMEFALRKAEGVLLNAQLRGAVKEVEKLTGTLDIALPRPRVKQLPGAPVEGPEGVPNRKINLKTLSPERRTRADELTKQAKLLKNSAQVANTVEQKQTIVKRLREIVNEIKQELADENAEREVIIRDKLTQREDVVQGMVHRIAAPPEPAIPSSAPTKESGMQKAGRFMGRTNLSPETLSLNLFGEGSQGHELIINNIRRSQDNFYKERHRFNDAMSEAFEKADLKPGTRKLDSWINDRHDVSLPDVGKVNMTRNEMVEIVAAAADPETAQLVADGVEWNFAGQPRHKPIAFTPFDIESMDAMLTPGEKGLIYAFRNHNKQHLTKPSFEAKQRISGWAPDPHENYFPRARNRQQSETAGLAEGWKGLRRKYLENTSSMEERSVDPKTPMLVKGFMETTYGYADDAAKLIHLAETVRDAAMVLEDPRLKGAIQRRLGESMNKRFRQLLDDTLGVKAPRSATEGKINWAMRNLARGWLQLNPSPMLKNVIGGSAMVMPEFQLKHLAAGTTEMFSPATYAEMLEHSGVVWDRYNGGLYGQHAPLAERHTQAVAQMTFGEALKAREMGRAVDALPFMQWADSVPLRLAWASAKAEVKERGIHRDQFWDAVAERFHDVLYRTQNGTSSTEISGLASDARQNPYLQPLLMFKSDRNKKWNGIVRAFQQGDGAYRAKMAAALLMSAAGAAGVGYGLKMGTTAIGNKLAGKPIDEKENKRQLKNIPWQIGRDLAGDVPGGELTETIFETFKGRVREIDLKNPVEQAAAQILSAIVEAGRALESHKWGKATEKGLDVLIKLLTLLGIPAEPTYQLGKRIYKGAAG